MYRQITMEFIAQEQTSKPLTDYRNSCLRLSVLMPYWLFLRILE